MQKIFLPEQLHSRIKISLHGWLACWGEMSSCDDHGKCPMKLQLIPQTSTDSAGYGINRNFRAWWLEIHTIFGVNLVRTYSCCVHTSQVFELHVLTSITSHQVVQHSSNAGHLHSGGSRFENSSLFSFEFHQECDASNILYSKFQVKSFPVYQHSQVLPLKLIPLHVNI